MERPEGTQYLGSQATVFSSQPQGKADLAQSSFPDSGLPLGGHSSFLVTFSFKNNFYFGMEDSLPGIQKLGPI